MLKYNFGTQMQMFDCSFHIIWSTFGIDCISIVFCFQSPKWKLLRQQSCVTNWKHIVSICDVRVRVRVCAWARFDGFSVLECKCMCADLSIYIICRLNVWQSYECTHNSSLHKCQMLIALQLKFNPLLLQYMYSRAQSFLFSARTMWSNFMCVCVCLYIKLL